MDTLNHYADLVLVIDATARMASHLDKAKNSALDLIHTYLETMDENDTSIGEFRVRVIAFRDFAVDSEPIEASRFFTLPEEESLLCDFLSSVSAKGGQGDAACVLEAIALALKSEFTDADASHKHNFIAVFTSGPALRLGLRKNYPSYPEGMPSDLNELGYWWEIECPNPRFLHRGRRMLYFGPESYPVRELMPFNCFWHVPCGADFTATPGWLSACADFLAVDDL